MDNKYFVTLAFVCVIIVTILTTLTTIYVSQMPFLKGPGQEGTVDILGGILPVVDVIIIDSSVIFGVSDTIQFSGVVSGGTYTTDINPATTDPYPFVIRNNGNVRANIEINQRRTALQPNLGLFDDPASRLKYWVGQSEPIIGVTGYSSLDNCLPLGSDCFIGASCSSQPNPTDASCIIPIANTNPEQRVLIINSLNYIDATDEAFLHILIHIDNNEPAGTKSTIITLTGSQA